MRILICDDDVMIQRELTKYLSEYFHRHNLRVPDICRFHTGHDLLMDSGNKDIVFLMKEFIVHDMYLIDIEEQFPEQLKYFYGKGWKKLKDKVLSSSSIYKIH